MKFEVRGPAFTMFRIPLSSLGRSLIRDLDGWVVIGEGRIVEEKQMRDVYIYPIRIRH
jgi:hypothetical protein